MTPRDNPFDDYGFLLELVQFAISRETEAVGFYRGLAGTARTESVAAELRGLAAMEEGHRGRLEHLDVAGAASVVRPGIRELKIADYRIQDPAGQITSREELLSVAVQREIASIRLYTDMANLLPDSMLNTLLLNLAAEEEAHRRYVESLRAEDL